VLGLDNIEWDIIDKIKATTVDNGKNVIKAVNGTENIELIRCIGNTLNLIVKRIVEYTNISPKKKSNKGASFIIQHLNKWNSN
jgi:hypothetical protein